MATSMNTFESREPLFSALSERLGKTLQAALSTRGQASMAVSGGSTPAPLYEQLSQQTLDWANTTITLTDERYVPVEHADSNQAMLQRSLLIGPAAAATLLPLMRDGESPQQTALASSDALAAMHSPLDVVILGMGNDMHTASLFPDAPELSDAMHSEQTQQCIALQPESSPNPRLSMSLNRLLDSREIILLITGQDKRQTLEDALKCDDTSKAPVAAILQQQQVPVAIYWSP